MCFQGCKREERKKEKGRGGGEKGGGGGETDVVKVSPRCRKFSAFPEENNSGSLLLLGTL